MQCNAVKQLNQKNVTRAEWTQSTGGKKKKKKAEIGPLKPTIKEL